MENKTILTYGVRFAILTFPFDLLPFTSHLLVLAHAHVLCGVLRQIQPADGRHPKH